MRFTANFIGAGKVGQTLGYLFHQRKLIDIKGICNQTERSSQAAISFIGSGTWYDQIVALPSADITFITTDDANIHKACEALCQNKHLQVGSVILHCSGVLSTDVLLPLEKLGCRTVSIHPMRSFAEPRVSVEHFDGTYCAIEGEKEATLIIRNLFQAIGSIVVSIDKSKKSLYHTAGVFASNYLVTLAAAANQCLIEAGINQPVAQKIIASLMQTTVTNLTTMEPKDALTGPLKRKDFATIQLHMDALENSSLQSLYTMLAEATLALIKR